MSMINYHRRREIIGTQDLMYKLHHELGEAGALSTLRDPNKSEVLLLAPALQVSAFVQ